MKFKLNTPINTPDYLQPQNQLRSSERMVTDSALLEFTEPRSGETKNVHQTKNTNQHSTLPLKQTPTAARLPAGRGRVTYFYQKCEPKNQQNRIALPAYKAGVKQKM